MNTQTNAQRIFKRFRDSRRNPGCDQFKLHMQQSLNRMMTLPAQVQPVLDLLLDEYDKYISKTQCLPQKEVEDKIAAILNNTAIAAPVMTSNVEMAPITFGMYSPVTWAPLSAPMAFGSNSLASLASAPIF
ncbi:hypothetical protein BGZ49_006303 [Haplosporangium sp. Z 27]|nr:hypothetical protein BGZ49_006303 [Haplosporangium sp. Z 27]